MRINIGFCESEGIGEHSVVSGDNVGSDFLNDFHAVNNFTEGGVFTPSSHSAVPSIMKNWLPAESGICDLAMDITPSVCKRSFLKPLLENSPLIL